MTKEEKIKREIERLRSMYSFEQEQKGQCSVVFGIDEAGRGPLCGPVVAACTVLPENAYILWLNDSKKLSEKKRGELYPVILEKALAYGIGMSSPERIDRVNILNATLEAMKEAYEACRSMLREKRPDITEEQIIVLVDGNRSVPGIRETQKTVIGGDAKCPSVSAASILAKVTRDRLLEEYDRKWPEYGFARHKGYGTKEHIEAIRKFGLLPVHRRSFAGKFADAE